MSFPASVRAVAIATDTKVPHRRSILELECFGGTSDELYDPGAWLDDEDAEEAPPPPMVALPAEWPAPHGG